jgi:hypothetical protein
VVGCQEDGECVLVVALADEVPRGLSRSMAYIVAGVAVQPYGDTGVSHDCRCLAQQCRLRLRGGSVRIAKKGRAVFLYSFLDQAVCHGKQAPGFYAGYSLTPSSLL